MLLLWNKLLKEEESAAGHGGRAERHDERNASEGNSFEDTFIIIQEGLLEKRCRPDTTSWEKGTLLGNGLFGLIYNAIDANGVLFAVEEVWLPDESHSRRQPIDKLEQEIALLSQFEHENIVQYYGTYKDKDERKLYIFMELETQSSLLKLYQTFHLQDSQVSAYTRQILHGLKYLHNRNVVHSDIKCANILVHANGRVKLANFGLAKAIESDDLSMFWMAPEEFRSNDPLSLQGTVFWMAPELINGKNQGSGFSADIWSLGCTVLEMLTRNHPYPEVKEWYELEEGIPPSVPDYLSKDARAFILRCLQVEASRRPTATELLDDPFIKRRP